jgi:hypothetical protein
MKSRSRFTQEQRLAILEGYAASNLGARQYADLNHIGFSTLAKWAREEGVSLRRKKKGPPSADFQEGTAGKEGNQQNSCGTAKEIFSFIDMTGYAQGVPFEPRVVPAQGDETARRARTAQSCGMEIRLPNGIMIRLDQVSAHEFWSRAIGFVRALA